MNLVTFIQFNKFLIFDFHFTLENMIKNFETFDAHHQTEITSLCLLESNKLASLGHGSEHGSELKIWDLSHFLQDQKVKLYHSYANSMIITQTELLVGNGQGQIIFLDKKTLSRTSTVKIHEDSINDILLEGNNIITVGNDGKIVFTDRLTLKQITRIDLDSPLTQILRFKDKYYVSGTKSYKIDSDFQIEQISRFNKFLTFKQNLYGANDEKGFDCISKRKNTYVPCENMIGLSQGILGSSWSAFSYFTIYEDDQRISYRSSRIQKMLQGDTILSFVNTNNQVYAGSEAGNIYRYQVNQKYNETS